MTFMPFIGSQTFRVKFSENSLWSNILNYLQTKVTPRNPHSCIFFNRSWRSESFGKLNFFSFGLASNQKSFNAACNSIFLHFWAAIMDFFNILKWSVFFLLKKLQEEFSPVKYHLCWICTLNKNKALKIINFCFSVILWNLLWSKFWNDFQAEIIS